MISEQQMFDRARHLLQPQIEIGVIGWDGVALHYDKGDPNGNDGERHTLIRVTLFRGKDLATAARPGSGDAKGYQVLCRIADNIARIPKPGAVVYIAVPFDMHEQNGAGVIIAVLSNDPDRIEEDRRMLDATGEHLVIKAKSITLESDGGDFLSVGAPRAGGTAGVTICSADGSSGAVWQTAVASMWTASGGDAKSVVQLTPAAAEIVQKDTGFLRLKGNELVTRSGGPTTMVCAKFGAGPNPAAFVPVIVGPTGIAGVASLMVSFGGLV